jgi:predicted enzyme related to lactoylglutathione lyase
MSSETTPPAAPGIGRIAQIAVNARDLGRATAFYRDVLGLRFLFEVPRMAFFDCGGIRLLLGLPEKPEYDHASSILYFDVPDIQAAHATLVERGVEFEGAPHKVASLGQVDLWMAFFRDPEGNFHALYSEVRT